MRHCWLACLAISLVLSPAGLALADPPAWTISESQPLAFGSFVPNNGGRLRVHPDGSIERMAGQVITTGNHQAGRLWVSGPPNEGAQITFSPTTVELNSGAHPPMIVRFFRVGSGSRGTVLTNNSTHFIDLDNDGLGEFNVGASLWINPDQPAGNYTGQIQVTLVYD